MASKQQPDRAYGEYLFRGYINPDDRRRSGATQGGGIIAVFSKKSDPAKVIHFTERDIRKTLEMVERSASQGVTEERKFHHLFNAVRAGISVHPAVQTCPIKPEGLYMLLDGMYGGKPTDIQPYGVEDV